MDIEAMTVAVAKWASTQPLIQKAYLYGGRVRGTHQPDSDLDVAVELFTLPGDESLLATWIREAQQLKTSIAGVVPVIIDLDWYGGADQTPCVHAGLQSGNIVAFDAGDTASSPLTN
jgi:predicted nucleotidyltransferase